MDLVALQLLLLAAMLVVNLLCVFVPVRFFGRSRASCNTTQKTQRVLDLCNSLSAGVFLGTCYVQLIPYVQTKFRALFAAADLRLELCDVTAQCVIMAGFFMILVVEMLVHACHGHGNKGDKGSDGHVQMNGLASGDAAHSLPDSPDGYDASSDSSLSIDLETDDPKASMLTNKASKSKTSKNKQKSTTSCSSHSHGGGAHATESHSHQHGHSHGLDMVTAGQSSGLRCVLLLAALSCHSLFEGVAVGLQDSVPRLVNLYIGVLIHEALVAFAIGVSLARQPLRRALVLQLGVVFSLMIPVGMAIGLGIGEAHGLKAAAASVVLQGLAAGTFVYVVFLEVIPVEINATKDKALRVLLMLIGFGLILCLALGLHDD